IILHNDPQIVTDLATFAGLFSFMRGSYLASPPGVLNKITFAILILFALVGIHCPLVCELHNFR
ncbi:MAG: hypothetical protein WAJ93_09160, partial [Candidatus Nitrosopolaris sp.]